MSFNPEAKGGKRMDRLFGAGIILASLVSGSAFVALLVSPPTIISNWFRKWPGEAKFALRVAFLLSALCGSLLMVLGGIAALK